VGRTVQKGKSAGTLESGKWVGPVTSPVTGEIVAINEAMKAKPSLINSDPYGEGWFVKVRPTDWTGESASLVTGDAGVAAYQKFIEEQNLSMG
jgi:glycine cleavage system H protein